MLKNEKHIIDSIYSGDRKIFSVIYKEYFNALCSYATNYVDDREEVKNIVQDVIINIWENRAKANEIKSLRSYLFGSVHNQCLNNIKHKRIVEKHQENITLTLKEMSMETVDFLESEEDVNMIHRAIESLPEQTKKVFKMKRFESLSYKEIAEHLQISDRTVDTHMTKAMKLLKEKLGHLLMVLFITYHLFYFSSTEFNLLSLLGL